MRLVHLVGIDIVEEDHPQEDDPATMGKYDNTSRKATDEQYDVEQYDRSIACQ